VNVIDRNAVSLAEFRAVFAQGHGQTKLVQRSRVQSVGEMVEVAVQAGYAILQDMGFSRSRTGGHARCLQAHQRHPLAQPAMQFRGHALALLFLLAEQAGCQRLQLLAVPR
jgi:hypothetical protein